MILLLLPMDSPARTILHADMDAFFASVEQRDDPGLRGLPVAVAGPLPRGVVSAASYEARKLGVHSAMPTAQALRLCPDLVLVTPRHGRYSAVSSQVFEIFRRFTPLVEPLSVDEAFLDLQGTERLHGPPLAVAHSIKDMVRRELDLVVSVGIGPNKFVAKLASDLGKPDGLVVVTPQELRAFLDPLPVGRLFGAGEVTQQRLHALGLRTVGQVAAFPPEALVLRLGALGAQLSDLARGLDPRPVQVDQLAESLGHEDTFSKDIHDIDELFSILKEQADRVASRLRHEGLVARTVVLKVKTARFKLLTRRRSLSRPTSDGSVMGQVACDLLHKLHPGLGPLRLTGVVAAGLTLAQGPRQLTFEEPEQQQEQRLGKTLDEISARFGVGALMRGSRLKKKPGPEDAE